VRSVWTISRSYRTRGRRPPHASPNPRQRGSTLILVLAILSILILIAATLSYTARLEEISSRNFSDGIQSRMAAQTGVGWFFALADGRTSPVMQSWVTSVAYPAQPFAPQGIPRSPFNIQRSGFQTRPFAPRIESDTARASNQSTIATDLVQLRVSDESAKININALGSWAEFGGRNASPIQPGVRSTPSANQPTGGSAATVRPISLTDALYAILSSPEVNYPGASREMARRLAYAIVQYRYGRDGQPGLAGVDDDDDGPGRSQMDMRGTSLPSSSSRSAAISSRNLPFFESSLGLIPTVQPATRSAVIAHDGLDNDGDGVVDESDEGIDEPDEFVSDPRLPSRGDDRPFRQIADLRRVAGITPEIFQVLRPYVTVFSASERRTGPARNAPAQMDLNASTLEDISECLRAAFPGVAAETIAQFAANIVDYRDGDSVPTQIRLDGATDSILGVEVAPCITEVWPDSVTSDREGDNGEYVEIYNPYDTAISLSGWSLQIAGGGRVALRGVLVPGGFLIVTDNYNGRNNPQSTDEFVGYGSFYRIFGVVPNSRNHLMIEVPTLEIPNESGVVELRDAAGNLVDFFRYGGGAAGNLRRSYQRDNPRLRVAQVARCTPYALGGSAARDLIPARTIKNAPFQSALELFEIGTALAVAGSSQQATKWQTPSLSQGRADMLDERLLDLFTVWTDRQPVSSRAAAGDTTSVSTLSGVPSGDVGPSPLTEWGKINLNTAPVPVLRALPGLSDRQIGYMLSLRQTSSGTDIAGNPIAYARSSELLADDTFWSNIPLSARLGQLANWIGSLSFSSNAYLIDSENLTEPPSGPRLASRSKVQALVSTDGGRNQVVFWRYLE